MLVVKTGMAQEYAIAKKFASSDVLVLTGIQTVADLEAHVPKDCKAILSFGLCGGLESRIEIGELMVAYTLVTPTGTYKPNYVWGQRFLDSMPRYVKPVSWYSSGLFNTANTPAQRADLYAKYKASVIDDETCAVAEFASKRGIPWQALRSCSDGAFDTVPPAAVSALNADGTDNTVNVLASICADPLQIPALIGIAYKFGISLGTLRFAAAHVGGHFQWV